MTDAERREAVRQFIRKWSDPNNGNENQHARSYWIEVFKNLLGAEDVTDRLDFEKNVIVDGHTKHIDAYIPETHVLIEQKSKGIALDKPGLQSGGDKLTPYEQAKRYNDNLAYDEKARWIVTSNFSEIWIYDMNTQTPEPKKLTLTDLQNKYSLLEFLVKKEVKKLTDEEQISKDAGAIVALLRNALEKQYHNMEDLENQQSLNALCVRLVFCLYAEDANIFGRKNMFRDYLSRFDSRDMRRAIIDLFKVLDIDEDVRDPYLDDELAQFPYVNGGLFSNEHMVIPQFTDEIRDILLEKAAPFDWAGISPTIFGAIFESTLNPETRREGGMHYTSLENIHKVIDPLFLDEFQKEFDQILETKTPKTRIQKLETFQNKIAGLTFLDPACGSGNFLTESYLSLRKLENEIIREKEAARRGAIAGQISFGDVEQGFNPIKVSIQQFYGIEINDFACTVAKTALWIAESQMMKKTEDVLHINLRFLPLKSYVNITEGNALRIDWNQVVSSRETDYVMGNPPFVGTKLMTKAQKEDTKLVLGKWKSYGTLDYVACWFKKTAEYIQNSTIRAALVSTNSISQGEQVAYLWQPIFSMGIHIDFAYKTFRWDNEANDIAHVHCVIVGLSYSSSVSKKIFEKDGSFKIANNINGYLVDAPTIFINNRKTPLQDVPHMHNGCKFLDDGNYVLTEEEKELMIQEDPYAQPFIRKYLGARNFISNTPLYCIWLQYASPALVKKSASVLNRIDKVKNFRLSCKSPDTNKYAERPMLPTRLAYYSVFRDTDMLVVPIVSSQRRRYIPVGYVDKDTIVSYSCMVIPDASLYSFGVIESNIHSAWMRTLCGRMKSDYRYSNTIVYNNYPWPTPTEDQKKRIEKTAQNIIKARELYPDCSLADLYDPLTMPTELQKAHTENDKAVMAAYGFSTKMTEEDCVAELMKMYQKLVEEKES